MRNRLQLLPKKREAYTAIRRFMCDGDVNLKVEEEIILDRWIYCDALLRAKELSEEDIATAIAEKFSVSVFTGRNDVAYAQKLFAEARKINKKYLIHLHLQRIDADIERLRKEIYKDDRIPDPKEIIALSKLQDSYTYTLNSVPEETTADKQPPPVFQFILAPGQQIDTPMQLSDAMVKADELLLKQNPEGIYEVADEEQQ